MLSEPELERPRYSASLVHEPPAPESHELPADPEQVWFPIRCDEIARTHRGPFDERLDDPFRFRHFQHRDVVDRAHEPRVERPRPVDRLDHRGETESGRMS